VTQVRTGWRRNAQEHTETPDDPVEVATEQVERALFGRPSFKKEDAAKANTEAP